MAALLTALLLLGACEVNQPLEGLSPADRLEFPAVSVSRPSMANVSYGPDPAHRLDVHLPTGQQRGTIVYFHSGGWIGGTKAEIVPFIRSLVGEGYALVSVDYRLAPEFHYREILADADRALRYVRRNATALKVDATQMIVAGSSAGGYIAAMLGAIPGFFADPTLPNDLAQTSPHVIAVINQVGPTNLDEFWRSGELARSISDSLLGCAVGPYVSMYPRCAPNEAKLASPWFWASLVAWFKGSLPPIYSAYGAVDTLVQPASQGRPFMDAWESAAGWTRAYYDNPPTGGHTLDSELNRTILNYWLSRVGEERW